MTAPTRPATDAGEGDGVVQPLIDRSRRLGADKRNTNYAGGNTSAKGTAVDPVTGGPVELLWVKGSGGDLGTLTEAGLAVLRLDRLRSLVDVYPGVDREDEMVAAFDHCLFGRGGAAPSIDTAMHGLVESAHVDHLHPDSGIALATAADGEALTLECFGDRVAWVPWRRPGFQLGLDIAAIRRSNPGAIGVVLGGHGITAWGDSSDACEANSIEIIRTAERFIAERGRAEPFGADRRGTRAAPAGRASRAGRRPPADRPRPRLDGPRPGRPLHRRRRRSSTSSRGSRSTAWPRWARPARTTSCGRRCGRWCWTCRRRRRSTRPRRGCASCMPRTATTTRPTTSGTPPPTARRCAAPTRRSSSCRASGCSASGRTSRPPASPASSTSTRST